jgi:hypothetical protein
VLQVPPEGFVVPPAGVNVHPFTARHAACVIPVQLPGEPMQLGDQKHPAMLAQAM